MAERASVQEVRDELHAEGWDTTGVDDDQIDRRIKKRAHPIVENELSAAGVEKWRCDQIEPLLAAHYLLASGNSEIRQTERESEADGSDKWYAGDTDAKGLRGTTLGQQAIELDTSGTLAEMAARLEDVDEGSGTEFEFQAL